MSRLTNIRSNVKNKEFGNQTYRSTLDFATQMRVATEKAKTQLAPYRESELVRPYVSESYEEMEYHLVPEAGMYTTPTAEIAPLSLRYDVPWTDPYVGMTFEPYWGPVDIGVSSFIGTFYPAVDGDDGYIVGGTFASEDPAIPNYMRLGNRDGSRKCFIRLPNSIPAGAKILLAKLALFTGNTSSASGSVIVKGYFNKAAKAVAPTSVAEYNALSKTTQNVDWGPLASFSQLTYYEMPPLTKALQEVVNLPGRKDNDAVMVMIEDNGSGINDTRVIAVRESFGEVWWQPSAQLQVIWEI